MKIPPRLRDLLSPPSSTARPNLGEAGSGRHIATAIPRLTTPGNFEV